MAEALRDDDNISQPNELQRQWPEEHRRKIRLLEETIRGIGHRLDGLGEELDSRLQSEEYLALVKKAFRVWDEADTDEKRQLLSNALTNSAGTRATSDDVIRLFIDWIKT